ncbi:SNF2-related protein [Niveomyces insectorum RCEF 264]|uniref:SNF2-related protein n=1 Tax=Niveomyces insectorum RCEF 264 TaxID=1081102 RepID=A0A167X4M0_9HYPO|nr:SNF2-related protein [Niveomyces insectorum RCEF 264]
MSSARRSRGGYAAAGQASSGAPLLDDSAFYAFVTYLINARRQDGQRSRPLVIDDDSTDEDRMQPPAKRPRTEFSVDYIPVARTSFSFRRPASDVHLRQLGRPPPLLFSCDEANGVLGFRYREADGLALSPQKKPVPAAIRKVVFSPREIGKFNEADALVLHVAERTASKSTPPGPGHFWTAVSYCVDGRRNGLVVTVDLELRWNKTTFVGGDLHSEPMRELRRRVLATFFPEVLRGHHAASAGSPQDFYEAAHVPSTDDGDENDLAHVPGLMVTLLPFQRRSVKWLLQREGVRWQAASRDAHGDMGEPSVVPYQTPVDPDTTSHFACVKDADGRACYVSNLFGVVTDNPAIFEANERAIRGGILSEEMGLGKTVEMISLMLLHPRPPEPPDSGAVGSVPPFKPLRPIGATLIVTPPALQSQWISEIQRHAPRLTVMVYSGMARTEASPETEAAMVEQLAAHDVVVTTYSNLRSELHFAVDPPSRDMRGERKHYRPRSPLVQLSWWRVCLDEAQEVESGVSNTATVVRVIPRVHAWGVTGTPVKDGVQDLWGLLLFLHYQPYAAIPKVWQDLIKSHKQVFQRLFGRIALRHSKRIVGDELSIPPQKRYVITMPFTAVEEQHYQSLFKELAEACGLDTLGAPLSANWNPDDAFVLDAMRSALNRLRQTALHPEIGERNRRALGNRAGPMRTVAEVLDAMIEQSENALLSDQRAFLSHKLKRGQLLENSPRAKEALEIWQSVLKEGEVLVQEAREKLRKEVEKAKETGASDGVNNPSGNEGDGDGDGDDEQSDSGNDDDDGPYKAASGRVGEAQRDLRYALEILHEAEFFCANGYFQIKSNEEWTEPESDEFKRLEKLEVEGYERAKRVRREILHENRSKAMRLMADLAGKASSQGFVTIPECTFGEPEGIEGRRICEELEALGAALDDQAAQIDEWREAVIQLLLKDLVDEDEEDVEITGDEYENSTKVQDEIQAYITILKAAISDRQAALTGLAPSGLALYEERLALRMATDGEGPAPELMLRLFKEREAVLPATNDIKSLRVAVVDMRDIAARLRQQASAGNQRAQMELACMSRLLARAQDQQTRQLKVNAALEKETNKVRNALNTRIEYYRQLQIVSDMVALYEGPKDDATIAASLKKEAELGRALAAAESKHRYLVHLKEADTRDETRMCVICQSPFSVGVLTVCGHQFCKECITLWFRAHRNCPMCKRRLNAANLHDITLKPQELKVVSESGHVGDNSGDSPGQHQDVARSKRTGIYASFSTEKLAEVKNIDLPGPSFTTKVDTLVRHLLWLRTSDPGAKSIVFSQFPAFLNILSQAFKQHRIGFSKYTDRNGIAEFKENPAIECFLLHARAHSSGLNLVNASHVVLCEPLLNTALELQAIARVHRIGQEHETTVWLYIVDGTVEESIYNLSVQRRLEHMGRSLKGKSKESTPELLDNNLELANSLELQQAQLSKLMSKDRLAGEEVPKGDLWTCLFGSATRPAAEAAAEAAADTDNEDRLRNNPTVRRYLATAAAEERRREAREASVEEL